MRELSDKEQVMQSGRSLVILIVGPDLPLVARRARLLRRTGYIVLVARAIDHAVRLALDSDCDLVLLCHRFDDGERQAIRNRLKSVRRLLTTVSLQESDDTDPRCMLAQIASTKM
jgi:DNA-binding response OmpR family regulator